MELYKYHGEQTIVVAILYQYDHILNADEMNQKPYATFHLILKRLYDTILIMIPHHFVNHITEINDRITQTLYASYVIILIISSNS